MEQGSTPISKPSSVTHTCLHSAPLAMPKRKVLDDKPLPPSMVPKRTKPRPPKITVHSDPTIPDDYDKIEKLLERKKTWRWICLKCPLKIREIANYFEDHNAETIKKRYNLCRRVIMETFSPEEVFRRCEIGSDP